jgi:hypothetical protein
MRPLLLQWRRRRPILRARPYGIEHLPPACAGQIGFCALFQHEPFAVKLYQPISLINAPAKAGWTVLVDEVELF